VKKLLLLVALSTIGTLMFASVASAQSVGTSASVSGGVSASGCNPNIAPLSRGRDVYNASSGTPCASPVPVPPSGGSSILLPAAALLVGSGILTYAILRRR
jgi:ABC-type cobalt transport system substrate-binding protein